MRCDSLTICVINYFRHSFIPCTATICGVFCAHWLVRFMYKIHVCMDILYPNNSTQPKVMPFLVWVIPPQKIKKAILTTTHAFPKWAPLPHRESALQEWDTCKRCKYAYAYVHPHRRKAAHQTRADQCRQCSSWTRTRSVQTLCLLFSGLALWAMAYSPG